MFSIKIRAWSSYIEIIGGSRGPGGARAPLLWEKFGWLYRESLKHDRRGPPLRSVSGPPLGKVLDLPLEILIWLTLNVFKDIVSFSTKWGKIFYFFLQASHFFISYLTFLEFDWLFTIFNWQKRFISCF